MKMKHWKALLQDSEEAGSDTSDVLTSDRRTDTVDGPASERRNNTGDGPTSDKQNDMVDTQSAGKEKGGIENQKDEEDEEEEYISRSKWVFQFISLCDRVRVCVCVTVCLQGMTVDSGAGCVSWWQ